MNRQQRRVRQYSQAAQHSQADSLFHARKLIPVGQWHFGREVMNSYFYNSTSICLSINRAPDIRVLCGSHAAVSLAADCGNEDYLLISFSEHDAFYRTPRHIQVAILYWFGMFRMGDSLKDILCFSKPNSRDPEKRPVTYYCRLLSECRFPENEMRKTYIDGSMSIADMFRNEEAARQTVTQAL